MSNEVSTVKSLQERVTSRLQVSIGDIITDEDLKPIVERGIHEAFFQEKKTFDRWGAVKETTPAFIHTVVKDLLTEQVQQATEQYIADHEEEVLRAIQEVVRDSASTLLMEALSRLFAGPLHSFDNLLSERVSKLAGAMRQRFPDADVF